MSSMLVKCEAKSNRVKGIAFHPTLPWLLSALHNGTIQLWDYQLGVVLDKFEEHEGPVRGVCFHLNQPLFVSGGDDYKVKVWNYKLRRCLFTLLGHLDYIRTTTFHHEYPWILSASDDQTIRIWNWQSRQCMAVLTGHNHYVMCANFHPKEDLVVSCSLDQTVRVWDVSGLKEKTVSASRGPVGNASNMDLFGVNDAVVKFVLEGHERGVNWVEFHPTQPLIVSASDDRTIRLWRMNESKAWEIDTLRGHFNNVSCVTFHPKQDLIISNGEDKTIRVWDGSRRQLIHTFKRENDRFWIVTCHKNGNVVGAGHDAGMVVFKLDRERPLCAICPGTSVTSNHVFVVSKSDRMLTAVDENGAVTVLAKLRRATSAMTSGMKNLITNPFNATEINVIVTYTDSEPNGLYELFVGPNQLLIGGSTAASGTSIFGRIGTGKHITFVARNRFAVLQPTVNKIGIFSLQNELSKLVELPFPVESMFGGGAQNRVVLKTNEDKLVLFDLTSKSVLGSLVLGSGQQTSNTEKSAPTSCLVRQIIWSTNGQFCAILLKHTVIVCDCGLKLVHSVNETLRVKSGVWDSQKNVFVYATASHLKYVLAGAMKSGQAESVGDYGIIQTMGKTPFLVKVYGASANASSRQMVYVDKEGVVVRSKIFANEYLFKQALSEGNSDEVLAHLKSGKLLGSVTIGYLKKKGFPEVALQFVEDLETRFNLCLEFGHLSEAFAAATALNKKQVWVRLGREALRFGNPEIAEKCFIATHDVEQLQFLYLLTGNFGKLGKLSQRAVHTRDHLMRFNVNLLRGDATERGIVLDELGLEKLAQLARKNAKLLNQPETTVNSQTDPWPMTKTMDELFASQWEGLAAAAAKFTPIVFDDNEKEEQIVAVDGSAVGASLVPTVDTRAWGDDDLDAELQHVQVPVAAAPVEPSAQERSSTSAAPVVPAVNIVAYGEPVEKQWLLHRRTAMDLVVGGEFGEALSLLGKRIGLVNQAPLKELFQQIIFASQCFVPGLPFTQSIPLSVGSSTEPFVLFNLPMLNQKLVECLTHTGVGNSAEALASARYILHAVTVTLVKTEEEETQMMNLLEKATKYALAMLIETTRRAISTDPSQKQRELELALYLACQKLEPTHQLLVVGSAMNVAFRAKNFISAAHLARRIITGVWGSEDPIVASTTVRARKVLAAAEEKSTEEFKLNFDPLCLSSPNQLKLCAGSLTLLSKDEQPVQCPYCKSEFGAQDWMNQVCTVCQLSSVGNTNTLGLQLRVL